MVPGVHGSGGPIRSRRLGSAGLLRTLKLRGAGVYDSGSSRPTLWDGGAGIAKISWEMDADRSRRASDCPASRDARLSSVLTLLIHLRSCVCRQGTIGARVIGNSHFCV